MEGLERGSEHIVHTIAGERTARDTIDVVLILDLLAILDDSDTGEGAFTEDVLTLELGREVWRGDFSTETWGFPSVAEVSPIDRRVVSSIDSDVAPDLIPQTCTIEGEDVEGLPVDLSDVDGEVLLLTLSDELIGELGVGIESVALTDFFPFEVLTTWPSSLTRSSFLMRSL